VPDQVNEEIENLRLECDKVGAATQLAAIRVERKILEEISHALARCPAVDPRQ